MSKPITFRFWVPETTDTAPIDGSGQHRPTLAAVRTWLEAAEAAGGYVQAEQLTEEEIAKIADGNAQRAYYATVRGFVEEVTREIADGSITDADGAREWLEQSIDGCHDVIYTYAAMEVCRISKNDTAYFDDFGSDGAISESGIEWSKLAYCALLADVLEEAGDLEALITEAEEAREAAEAAADAAAEAADAEKGGDA